MDRYTGWHEYWSLLLSRGLSQRQTASEILLGFLNLSWLILIENGHREAWPRLISLQNAGASASQFMENRTSLLNRRDELITILSVLIIVNTRSPEIICKILKKNKYIYYRVLVVAVLT